MDEAQIIIRCPKCSKKALFKSTWNKERYVLQINSIGNVVCSFCGYNGSKEFSNDDYYYQLQIEDRKLFARNLDNLIAIRDFFQENRKMTSPEFDFPKLFYESKKEFIEKINKLLKTESGSC
jgi:hypothetical protein